VISNGQGLREDHDIARQKPPGEIRVLFVGDSCTFGYGLKHSEGFVDLVEKSLQAKLPGVSVECINAGVPGYTLFQGWRFLETTGFGYDPDLIVLSFGWNDADTWDGLSDAQHYAAMQAAKPPAWLYWSRLGQLIWATLPSGESSSAHSTKRARLSTEEYRHLLERVRESATARGIGVLALVWPMRENVAPHVSPDARTPMQAQAYAFGMQDKLQIGSVRNPSSIDLVPIAQALTQKHKPSDVFLDVGHGTGLANQVFAAAIVDRIEPIVRSRRNSR
jgi:lysophospholipase L1-like esterase